MKDNKLNIIQDFFLIISVLCLCYLRVISSQEELFCKAQNGESGYCINLKNQIKYCPKLWSWLKSEEPSDWDKLRFSLCAKDFKSENLRVCCPASGYDETPSNANVQNDEDSDADENYARHPNFKLMPQDLKCGYIRLSNRIIGGANAKPGDFPFMARIGINAIGETGDPFFGCSGTIINERYILTAAHCLTPIVTGTHKLSVIRLAETDESVNPESITLDGYAYATSHYLDFEHEEFVVHSDYIAGSTGSLHDIALIRLKTPINTTSDFTVPVCLPFINEYYLDDTLDDDVILRQNATVCGFGKTSNDLDVGSTVLQYVTVPINSNIMCRIVYARSHHISNMQICAGGLLGKNSCSGDSGGPLLRNPNLRAKASRYFQLGVVSYGKKTCAEENKPAVYTRVRSYLKWILDNIKP